MPCANVTSASLCALSEAGARGGVAGGGGGGGAAVAVAAACVSVPELLHALSVTTAANAAASAALNRLVCTRTPCSSGLRRRTRSTPGNQTQGPSSRDLFQPPVATYGSAGHSMKIRYRDGRDGGWAGGSRLAHRPTTNCQPAERTRPLSIYYGSICLEGGTMRFTVQYPIAHAGYDSAYLDPAVMTRFARAAEEAGFSAIAFTEHPAPSEKWMRGGGHDAFDPFAALGFCAAVTQRLLLMTLLLVLPYRNPLLAAKSAPPFACVSG